MKMPIKAGNVSETVPMRVRNLCVMELFVAFCVVGLLCCIFYFDIHVGAFVIGLNKTFLLLFLFIIQRKRHDSVYCTIDLPLCQNQRGGGGGDSFS